MITWLSPWYSYGNFRVGISDINGGAALSQAQLAPELKLLDAGGGKPGSRESRAGDQRYYYSVLCVVIS